MKKIRVEDAVGETLLHDITEIVPGKFKGVAFKRGHALTEDDIDHLKDIGESYIFIKDQELDSHLIFEEDGAEILANLLLNDGMSVTEVSEGKISILAEKDGFFKVDTSRLHKMNLIEDIMMATRLGFLPVKKGDELAATRIIPLFIREEKLNEAKKIGMNKPLLEILPFKKLKVGVIVTGREVYEGRIKDGFTEVLEKKLSHYNLTIEERIVSDDSLEMIEDAIQKMRDQHCDLILCTGGMSVDPDDLTPDAIINSGAEVVSKGSPVLPGAMFYLGYFEDGKTIMGLPGSVMFQEITVFDIILPYVLAGEKISKDHLAKLGYGGLALSKDVENYPFSQFGKGV